MGFRSMLLKAHHVSIAGPHSADIGQTSTAYRDIPWTQTSISSIDKRITLSRSFEHIVRRPPHTSQRTFGTHAILLDCRTSRSNSCKVCAIQLTRSSLVSSRGSFQASTFCCLEGHLFTHLDMPFVFKCGSICL